MRRSLEKEMMDLPGNPAQLLEEDLKNLRTINRALGAYRGVLRSLEDFRRKTEITGFSLLDVGAGSGDIAVAIVRWARRRGISGRVVALEPDWVTAALSRRQTLEFPEISIVRGDGRSLPFPPSSFDFVIASQMLHHFSEAEIIFFLRAWSTIARRAVLISDLIRHPLAYYGIHLLTRLFSRNEMTRVDAPLSVQRAFTLAEWRELFQRAGIGEFSLTSFFPFRLLAFFPLRA